MEPTTGEAAEGNSGGWRAGECPRSDLVYKTSAWLLCQAGMKWRKSEVMLPIPRSGTICFRNSPSALVRFSFHEIGESPRCCPVLRGLRDRCFAAKLATRKAEVSGHAPQAATTAPSGFQPAAARSSALTSRKWLPRMDSRHQPPGSEPGALAVELQGNTIRQPELHTGLSPIPAACVATNALAEFEMVGHLGAAPSVSPIRTARIAVFLMPGHVVSF